MANYNGLVAALTKDGSTVSQTLTGVSTVFTVASVPNKFFKHGQFACTVTQGVSGTFGIQIVGAVGGATYVIAGRTNITAVGSFPIPLVAYVGTSGAQSGIGIPRPYCVQFGSAGGVPVGFTVSVFLAGDY